MSQTTKPGNLDRGWNDPPVFLSTHSSSQSPAQIGSTAPRRNLLNRRVAFPVTSGTGVVAPNGAAASGLVGEAVPLVTEGMMENKPTTTASRSMKPPVVVANNGNILPSSVSVHSSVGAELGGIVTILPPSATTQPPQFTAPIIVPLMDTRMSAPSNTARNPMSGLPVAPHPAPLLNPDLLIPDFNDDEQMFHYVISRLYRAVNDCQEKLEARDIDGLLKKVGLFAEMWKNGKISYPVKCTMGKLATAVHRRRCDVARELHRSLLIDHVSEVSTWLIGIKRLIEEVETIVQPTSPSAVCPDELALHPTVQPQQSLNGVPPTPDLRLPCDTATTQAKREVIMRGRPITLDPQQPESSELASFPSSTSATTSRPSTMIVDALTRPLNPLPNPYPAESTLLSGRSALMGPSVLFGVVPDLGGTKSNASSVLGTTLPSAGVAPSQKMTSALAAPLKVRDPVAEAEYDTSDLHDNASDALKSVESMLTSADVRTPSNATYKYLVGTFGMDDVRTDPAAVSASPALVGSLDSALAGPLNLFNTGPSVVQK